MFGLFGSILHCVRSTTACIFDSVDLFCNGLWAQFRTLPSSFIMAPSAQVHPSWNSPVCSQPGRDPPCRSRHFRALFPARTTHAVRCSHRCSIQLPGPAVTFVFRVILEKCPFLVFVRFYAFRGVARRHVTTTTIQTCRSTKSMFLNF